MRTLSEIRFHLKKTIENALGSNLKIDENLFTTPPQPEMGDFSFPCFLLAKEMKQDPKELAARLSDTIHTDDIIASVRGDGGYVNCAVWPQVLVSAIFATVSETKKIKTEDKIMLEYSQPNTHKEFHVGHLRNVCLGNALVNILRENGMKIISVNYINDTGTHVAKSLWAFSKFHANEVPSDHKGRFLASIYVEATQKSDENEDAKKEIAEVLRKLEDGDPQVMQLWHETRQWSLDHFDHIYALLKVSFDHVFYDSELIREGKDMVSELQKKKIAKKSQGAILVDLEVYGLDVFLLQKSDGTALYATKDLALAKKKYDTFDIDESIIVTDTRQSFYFKQLFKTLELYGFKKKMIHIPYESVTLPSGAMSSRKGNVILFDDLFDQACEKARHETRKRHPEWDQTRVLEVSTTIALTAMKFTMLKHENNQIITFDLDAALSFEGDTGPYILYTYARIQSIFRKILNNHIHLTDDLVDYGWLQTTEERAVLRLMKDFNAILSESAVFYKPSLLAVYSLNLCHSLNTFYHQCPIVQEKHLETQHARVVLLRHAAQLIERLLRILNIPLLVEM